MLRKPPEEYRSHSIVSDFANLSFLQTKTDTHVFGDSAKVAGTARLKYLTHGGLSYQTLTLKSFSVYTGASRTPVVKVTVVGRYGLPENANESSTNSPPVGGGRV